MTKKVYSILLALVLGLSVAACGSGGTSTGGSFTAAEEQQILSLVQSLAAQASSSITSATSLVLEDAVQAQTTVDCPDGGSFTISATGDTITWTNCAMGAATGNTITQNGTLTSSIAGSVTTMLVDLTITDSSGTFTEAGTFTFDSSDNSFTMDVTGTFPGAIAYSIDGSYTVTGSSIITGTISITLGTDSATCTFNNFDTTTATEADYATACGF